MKTVNIKGKQYVEVNERVKYFIKNYPGWSIETEMLSIRMEFVFLRLRFAMKSAA